MTIDQYIKIREDGLSFEDFLNERNFSEANSYTLELGYQCYLKRLSLDAAINIIKSQ